jgi:quinol monooxygenase YgiN
MRVTQAILRIKPEKAELYEKTFHELRDKVLENEPGTTFFELCRDPEQPGAYRVFEAYADAEAIQAHVATDYYLETARIFVECLEGDHMVEIARRGLTQPRDMYALVNSLKLERFETV